MPQRPTRRRFIRCLTEIIAPSRQPECCITHFDASEGGGFLVECRGLHCDVGQEKDGWWVLAFSIWKTTVYPWGLVATERKVPSATLRENLARLVGVETRLEGDATYPSLAGQVRRKPDPNGLLRRMEKLMRGVELRRLYEEPRDGA